MKKNMYLVSIVLLKSYKNGNVETQNFVRAANADNKKKAIRTALKKVNTVKWILNGYELWTVLPVKLGRVDGNGETTIRL